MRDLLRVLCVGVIVAALGSSASGAIMPSGDVSPAIPAPAKWTLSTGADIGNSALGSVSVTDGDDLKSSYCLLGRNSGGDGTVAVDGAGSTWTASGTLYAGRSGNGMLDIKNGGVVALRSVTLGENSTGQGNIKVDGVNSSVSISSLNIGIDGRGVIDVTGGGKVTFTSSSASSLAVNSGATAAVTVDGLGSESAGRSTTIYVGRDGEASLTITNGGLVSAGHLCIDEDLDGGSFVNMATGGMLAVFSNVTSSLSAFMGEISGSENMRYWNGSIWTGLTGAAPANYSLTYMTGGPLDRWTVLQVGTAPCSGPLSSGTSVAVPSGGSSGAWSGGAGAGDNEVEVNFNDIDITGNGELDFAAETTEVTGNQYSSLFTLAAGSVSVNWSFTLNRELAGDESIDLVFDLGSTDLVEDDIHLWHYDSETETYTEITGLDFSQIDSGILTAAGIADFSDYTVTVAPEPATMSLLVLGGLAVLRRRRSRV